MKKMIIMGVTLFSILGTGSCTNNEGESEFDTVKPNLPTTPEEGTAIDTTAIQVKTIEVPKL